MQKRRTTQEKQKYNVAQSLRDVGSWMKPLGHADAVCILSGGCLNHDHSGQKLLSIIELLIISIITVPKQG